MAPDGWHLYVGTAVPRPTIGDFDEAPELVARQVAERYPAGARSAP